MSHETHDRGLKESHEAELERWKAIRAEKIARSIREEREARERRERLAVLTYVLQVNRIIRAGFAENVLRASARELWRDLFQGVYTGPGFYSFVG